jgi:hypothetical protein
MPKESEVPREKQVSHVIRDRGLVFIILLILIDHCALVRMLTRCDDRHASTVSAPCVPENKRKLTVE